MKKTIIKDIKISDLILLDEFTNIYPLKIDMVYANAEHPHNIFKTAIYKPNAKLWVHKEIAPIILDASKICYKKTGWIFEIKDCLRTTDAQELMQNTDIVKNNPHWLEEPNRLISPAGKGGHPRGMAVDIILVDKNGDEIDMGTHFDFFSEDKKNNPACRKYTKFYDDEKKNKKIIYNRQILENSMLQAAEKRGRELLPLPQEWWDFRFPSDYTNLFKAISDKDLPLDMRIT